MAVTTSMGAGQRRLVYGLNVLLNVVLALAVFAIVVWASGRWKARADLSSSRVNSLSSRTVALLRDLDSEITISGTYTKALKEVRPFAEKHFDRVSDLLDLYETAGRDKVKVEMIDPSTNQPAVLALLKRLREKPAYVDEAKPHAALIAEFPPLAATIAQLVQTDLEELGKLLNADARLGRNPEFAIVYRKLQAALQEGQTIRQSVDELTSAEAEVPLYGRAVQAVGDHLALVRGYLQDTQTWMTGKATKLSGLSPEVQLFLANAAQRYGSVLGQMDQMIQRAQGLSRVKLEDAYETLKRGETILVETPKEAQVLALEEVWPMRTDASAPPPPDGDPRDFAGEQAVSSAILKLTQKTKTAVVFARFGGQSPTQPDFSNMNPMMQQMPTAPYQMLAEALERDNFIVQDWDVATSLAPPSPEGASRTVYVVMTPAPAQQPSPMQPQPQPGITPQQKQAVLDAVSGSGLAIFLAGWAPPSGPGGMVGGAYDYADYLQSTWGIRVRYNFLALQFMVQPQKQGLWWPAQRDVPIVDSRALRFSDHKITAPLKSLPGALYLVCPLEIVDAASRPAGLAVESIIDVPPTEDVWAFSDIELFNTDLQKNMGVKPREGDLLTPFSVAVAGSNGEKRVVVFASERFAADMVAGKAELMFTGSAIQAVQSYPGNLDLFLNALHWLTGETNRIALGPRRSDVPLLDKLEAGSVYTFWKIFLVGIWPGLALLAGAGVWLMRRR